MKKADSISPPIPDLQSQSDPRSVTIDKVGIKGLKYPIIVDDQVNGTQQTVAEIDLYVELPHHYRGTHMSRFVEILHHYHQDNLIHKLPELLTEMKAKLKADAAYVQLRFPYFIKKKAPVSKVASYLDYTCLFDAALKQDYEFWIGVVVPVTTLCPCSKEISRYGAHNQRSHVTLQVRYSSFIWLEELIGWVESVSSCDIYALLKRVDEQYVTEHAYEHPMFVEDIIRELTLKLEKDTRIIEYRIESENIESIHNHSAYALKTSARRS